MNRELSSRQARQGPLGRPVLWVLATSLVLAGLVMIALYAWYYMKTADLSRSAGPLPPAIEHTTGPRAATSGTAMPIGRDR